MIPAFCDPAVPSAAERRMFELLKADPDTTEWVVLHSLGLARRGTRPHGEVDFVVLVPGAGVFCLEVKGGRISCRDGEWESTDRAGVVHRLNRSPFMQAREGMFSVRDAVLRRAQAGFPSALVFGYAVVMPDISFPFRSPEWESWQVIDRDALKNPIAAAVLRLATNQRRLGPAGAAGEPSAATIRTLQQLLRPDFEAIITCGAMIDETEARLRNLTEEQFERIDMLSDNPRCLIEGAAGTGKTMLAVEYARRAAADGRRTLLTCYNRLLADWLDRRAAEFGAGSTILAGGFYRRLREVIMGSSFAEEFRAHETSVSQQELFTDILPTYGQLAVEERDERLDVVVVDEAQDLIRPGVLAVLDSWLDGGLASGRWAFFGDFERQAIYGSHTAESMRALLAAKAPIVRGRLSINCRNTRNIGEETALLSGFTSPPYRLGQLAGIPVDYIYYTDAADQQAKLAGAIKRLLAGGVKAPDIMVVSRFRLENSGAAAADGPEFRLIEVDESPSSKSRTPSVRFSTAQAFKGMESPALVLCDVDDITEGEPQCLLYVAMSRARAHLTVLMHDSTRPQVREKIRVKLSEAWNRNP